MNQEASSPKYLKMCIGRTQEIEDVDELISHHRSNLPKQGLMYFGAPKIGKTTLLDCIEDYVYHSGKIQDPGEILLVRLSWAEDTKNPGWNEIWQQIYSHAINLPEEQFGIVTDLLRTHRVNEQESEQSNLFTEINEKVPDIMIIFLLDDLDSALIAYSDEIAEKILEWTIKHKNVYAIATSSKIIERYNNTFTKKRRLYLLSDNDAKILVKCLLENIDDDFVPKIFALSGNHPFLISRLCGYIEKRDTISINDLKEIIRKLEMADDVKTYLDDTWEYLDLYGKGGDARVVLARLASGEEAYRTDISERSDLIRDGLEYLRKGGVVAIDQQRISSVLVRDYCRTRLRISRRRIIRRNWSNGLYWLRRYRWTVFWSVFASWLVIVFVLRSIMANPELSILTATVVLVITSIFISLLSEWT